MEKALHQMFYDPKNAGGFAGREQLIRQAQRKGIRPRDVKYWLDGQPSYVYVASSRASKFYVEVE